MFRSIRTKQFREQLEALPANVQRQAEEAYALFKENPRHKGLHFSPVLTAGKNAYSVNIGDRYRAIGHLEGDTILWVWIGSHESYNRIVKQRR